MKRHKSSLLQGHLEQISWQVLVDYPKLVKEMIQMKSGVYALYKRDKLYYVGLAGDLRRRLKHHLKDRHSGAWDRFSVYLTWDDAHMKQLESLLLRIVKPPENRVSGRFDGSANLDKELSRLMRKTDEDRRARYLGGSMAKRRRAKATSKQGSLGLAGLVDRPIALRRKYKGKMYRARLLKSGHISFAGTRYNSPTQAGRAVAGGRRLNGWNFWKFQLSPKKWVPLTKIRGRRNKK